MYMYIFSYSHNFRQNSCGFNFVIKLKILNHKKTVLHRYILYIYIYIPMSKVYTILISRDWKNQKVVFQTFRHILQKSSWQCDFENS